MQEMVELSKLQSQQPEASPQAVSFPTKEPNGEEHIITVQAGPSHFGVNLRGDQVVKGKTFIVHPFNACNNLLETTAIKGKIAIVERGDCMFIDKARRIQKAGAIGGVILDNTPGSSAETSAMFSMSGDGNDDVKIPVVFLFAQDAFKLLLTLSKTPDIEVTISELKSNTEVWPPNEEESMFHKLKVSVQEFLNKHAGIGFTKTVTLGSFKADIGTEKIAITYEKVPNEDVYPEETSNPQWSKIRKGFLISILHSEQLLVPLNILRIYYQTLSGFNQEEMKEHDVTKQALWLLKELSIEHHKKDDDIFIATEKIGMSLLTDTNLLKQQHKLDDSKNDKENEQRNKNMDKIKSILQAIKDMNLDDETFDKKSSMTTTTTRTTIDDIVIQDDLKNKFKISDDNINKINKIDVDDPNNNNHNKVIMPNDSSTDSNNSDDKTNSHRNKNKGNKDEL